MKKLIMLIMLLVSAFYIYASFDASYSDSLFYASQDYEKEYEYLLDSLEKAEEGEEKSEILWRLSRAVLTQGDMLSEDDKDGRFSKYEQAEDYARSSLEEKENWNAYFWLSSAIGRWGQTKGPLNSLSKAPEMQEYILKVVDGYGQDYTDAYYVLALLYDQLPGWPISFGNKNYAISYMRRSLDTQLSGRGLYLTLYYDLSQMLYDRNWDAGKRAKEAEKMKKEYDSESILSEKMKYYEGANGKNGKPFYSSVTIDKMSDRQEAVMLLMYAKALYEIQTFHLDSDSAKYAEICSRLEDLT